jgi:3-phenylpropionate/cinnamic acid dioxygenase small subunit
MSDLSVHKDFQLQTQLQQYYEQYTNCLDDTDFDRWISFFTPDAKYQITSRENFRRKLPLAAMSCDGIGMIQDRVTALVKVLVYEPRTWRRFVSSLRIDRIEGDSIHSRANFLLYESMMDREPQLNMVGEYVDVVIRENGTFRFKERIVVYDNYRILTTLFAPV